MIRGLADRIEQAVKEKGYNYKRLSEDSNVSRHMLWQYRNYGITPGVEVLARIAKTLNVSMDWLVGISNDKELR